MAEAVDEDELIGSPIELTSGDSDEDGSDAAPQYPVPARRLAAVEIPAVVNNIDRAIKAFGRVPSLSHVLNPQRMSLPLYMNPDSPYCPSIMSHSARSHNVVLKLTVPKRTGRKRKRGSNGPWLGELDVGDENAASPHVSEVCSIARLDEPKVLRRKLADNVDDYHVEAVGVIKHTHRFRGLADFYWDMSKSSFSRRYVEQVLPGDVQQIKKFKFEPGIDQGPNVDIIPPPLFTHMSIPFVWNFSQNPYVRTTEDGNTINLTAVKQVGYFLGAEEPTPTEPQLAPDLTDTRTMEILAGLEEALQERPIWTRRALTNYLGRKLRNWNELKRCLNYAAYQFKGGPWRDGVVSYGIDPRSDPKYRIYQTLMFKLAKRNDHGRKWYRLSTSQSVPDDRQSHIFDGQSYCTDGKVWQVCDITEPLLKSMLDNAPIRPTWDVNSGWYHGGLWSKVKAIMKTKLVAVRFDRSVTRADFGQTLRFGDQTPPRQASTSGATGISWHLPLPSLKLTDEELIQLRGRKPPKKKSSGYNVRVRDPDKGTGASNTHGAASVPDVADDETVLREKMHQAGIEDDNGEERREDEEGGPNLGSDNEEEEDDDDEDEDEDDEEEEEEEEEEDEEEEEGEEEVVEEEERYAHGDDGNDDDEGDDDDDEEDDDDDDDDDDDNDGDDGIGDGDDPNKGQFFGEPVYNDIDELDSHEDREEDGFATMDTAVYQYPELD